MLVPRGDVLLPRATARFPVNSELWLQLGSLRSSCRRQTRRGVVVSAWVTDPELLEEAGLLLCFGVEKDMQGTKRIHLGASWNFHSHDCKWTETASSA